MSSIRSTHFNWLPQQSAYSQLQTQRAQFAAANDSLNTGSALAGSFSDAMSSQYAGIANLAADAAAKRLGIALPSQSERGDQKYEQHIQQADIGEQCRITLPA